MRCLSASEYTVLLFCNHVWPHTCAEIQPFNGHIGFTVPFLPVLLGDMQCFSAQSPSQLLLTKQTYCDSASHASDNTAATCLQFADLSVT